MTQRIHYRKKHDQPVSAVQLNLECEPFDYSKWNHPNTCKPGDWIVSNGGDTYTVEKEYFRQYYTEVEKGMYVKTGGVWVEPALADGTIETFEGTTGYRAGDYLVFDREVDGKGYAVSKMDFERMYEKIDETSQMSPEQERYITRVSTAIKKHGTSERLNTFAFYCFEFAGLLACAGVMVLSKVTLFHDAGTQKLITAFLGGGTAFAGGMLAKFKFQARGEQHAEIRKNLESSLAVFNALAADYSTKESGYRRLIAECEPILVK